ncbi:MAG: hypothetical protein HZB33_14625 [Nitrospirae bacterium]|nr:hypothetical protein [Nitrospirota bacterium]
MKLRTAIVSVFVCVMIGLLYMPPAASAEENVPPQKDQKPKNMTPAATQSVQTAAGTSNGIKRVSIA